MELLGTRSSVRRGSCRRRSSSRTPGVVGYNDISPRFGLAYDLFGNGRTAWKVNLGRYLDAASNNNGNSITNPTSRMAGSTELGRRRSRAHGRRNGNFIPGRNLSNPDARTAQPAGVANAGAISDRNFGTATLSRNFRSGGARRLGRASGRLGVRRVGAAGSAAARVGRGRLLPPLARQLLRGRQPRHGARRLHAVQHHRAIRPRLPDGGGYTIDGLYDVVPAKFGQVNDYFTKAENFGDWYQHYNGILLNVTARPRNGLTMQGGLLTGKPCATCAESGTRIPS